MLQLQVMALLKPEDFPKIRRFYVEEEKSMQQIADSFGVSIHAVVYFMRKYKLARRAGAEQRRVRFAQQPHSFLVKQKLTQKEEFLKTVGVALYWGEGFKSVAANRVDFANSDPLMIKAFLAFLRQVCGVAEPKLRVYLYCYANQKPEELVQYWSKLTQIPVAQFTSPYVRQDFLVEKNGKMPYGLIHIRYSDKKLLLLIKKWIEECKSNFDA